MPAADDPTRCAIAIDWPPTRAQLQRSIRINSWGTVISAALLLIFAALLVFGTGKAKGAGAVFGFLSLTVLIFLGASLLWWIGARRVLRASTWRATKVRRNSNPWNRYRDEVLFDNGDTGLTANVFFSGNETDGPEPRQAFVAGQGWLLVLTPLDGTGLMPLSRTLTSLGRRGQHRRWRRALKEQGERVPDEWGWPDPSNN